jgi:hypothetical protein
LLRSLLCESMLSVFSEVRLASTGFARNQQGEPGMKILAISTLLVLLGVIGPTSSEASDDIDFDFNGKLLADGSPSPWVVKVVAGKPKFSIVPIPEKEGQKHLFLHSEKSSFSLNRPTDVSVREGTRVSWSWKGEKLPYGSAADARVGSKCDQGLQVMLAFDNGTRVISYVWDTNAPVGGKPTTEGFAIHSLGIGHIVKVIVVQSGKSKLGMWSSIERNVFEDYRNVYNGVPKKVVLIRVQSNSQYTATEGAGYFSPITFTSSL